MDLDLMRKRSAPAEKLAAGIAKFETYIGNNRESIRTSGSDTGKEKHQHGVCGIDDQPSREPRFVKKQQMQWTLRGAHLLVTDQHESSQRRTRRCVPALYEYSARNHKPRRRIGRWLDPRVAAALPFLG